MKKLSLTLVILFLFQLTILAQPCLPEGIAFTTQTQIDSFQIIYPNCTEIGGDVVITGDDIYNLNGLDCLETIAGELYISGTEFLTNLEGLNNINAIGETIRIEMNAGLTSFTGLGGIFIGLPVIDGGLWLIDNDALINLNGLSYTLNIYSLKIVGNDALIDFAGLGNLAGISTSFEVEDNYMLTNFNGLQNLNYIGDDLKVVGNTNLTSLEGLNNLTYIDGDLILGDNISLQNISDLESLISLDGDLIIGWMDGTNIYGNPSLTSLHGLNLIEPFSIANLTITYNNLLEDCDVNSVCEYMASPNGTIEIHDNAIGCNDIGEIGIECEDNCLHGGIIFTEQAQIDSFQTNFPYCSEIEGYVHIGLYEGDISSLDGLNSISSIWGNFSIEENTYLENFTGLESLTSIGGYLSIKYNTALSDFTGLENLIIIEKSLIIGANSIENLNGLNNLIFIGGDLNIGFWQGMNTYGNPNLTSLVGLENLETIWGILSIMGNDSMLDLYGLGSLENIGGLSISNNDNLNSLIGLDLLSEIHGEFFIGPNTMITNMSGLGNLNSVGGDLIINWGEIHNFNGLENLSFIGGKLHLNSANNLESFSGLESLTSIGSALHMHGCFSLKTLNGLNYLESIGGELHIVVNDSLTDINALANIEAGTIDSLDISGNDLLSNCDIQSICNYLATPNAVAKIQNNAQGCNNQQEVEDACWTLVEDRGYNDKLTLYPNPVSSILTIEFELIHAETITISIYNHIGVEVAVIIESKTAGQQKLEWDCEELNAGIYFCVLKTNEGIQTRKIVKL